MYLSAAVIFTMSIASCSVFKPVSKSGKTPLMGWSTWNACMVDISDTLIRHQADLLVSTGLRDAGYSQVDIDDGFFGPRMSDGTITSHPVRFPDGMRGLVDHIHSLNMKAGIYSDAGILTCVTGFKGDTIEHECGLYGHDCQDADVFFNKWNFDFIKIDYCGGQKLHLDEEKRYLEIKRNLDSVARKPISINVCRWDYPGTWVSKAGDSWRIGGDIHPAWKSIRWIILRNLYLSAYTADGGFNDMDMMAVGYKGNPCPLKPEEVLSPVEEASHFGMWCMMSSPLLIGCKLENIPEESLELLKNKDLIALDQDPLGLQAYVVQHNGEGYVLVKDILKRFGKVRAVAFYNPSDKEAGFSVTPEELDFEGLLSAEDLISKEIQHNIASIKAVVPAHGVKIMRVTGKKRIEPALYEAEWAFMPLFSRIRVGSPDYRPCETASGGAVADGLGGSEENCLQWKEIYSRKGGLYDLSVKLINDLDDPDFAGRVSFKVSVNGVETPVSADMTENGEATLKCELKRGFNDIRIVSSGKMPAVDCLRIRKN